MAISVTNIIFYSCKLKIKINCISDTSEKLVNLYFSQNNTLQDYISPLKTFVSLEIKLKFKASRIKNYKFNFLRRSVVGQGELIFPLSAILRARYPTQDIFHSEFQILVKDGRRIMRSVCPFIPPPTEVGTAGGKCGSALVLLGRLVRHE